MKASAWQAHKSPALCEHPRSPGQQHQARPSPGIWTNRAGIVAFQGQHCTGTRSHQGEGLKCREQPAGILELGGWWQSVVPGKGEAAGSLHHKVGKALQGLELPSGLSSSQERCTHPVSCSNPVLNSFTSPCATSRKWCFHTHIYWVWIKDLSSSIYSLHVIKTLISVTPSEDLSKSKLAKGKQTLFFLFFPLYFEVGPFLTHPTHIYPPAAITRISVVSASLSILSSFKLG